MKAIRIVSLFATLWHCSNLNFINGLVCKLILAHCELKLALNLQYSTSIMWVRFRIACCLRTELDEQHPLSIGRISFQSFGFKLQIEIAYKALFCDKNG